MRLEPFGFTQGRFGEGHFDRIEIWTIGRQEEEPGAALPEDGLGLCALVAGQLSRMTESPLRKVGASWVSI
jgi:hypothetical protein